MCFDCFWAMITSLLTQKVPVLEHWAFSCHIFCNLYVQTYLDVNIPALSANLSPSGIAPIPEENDSIIQDTTSILETLSNHIKHGGEIVQSICAIYRISVNTGKSYQSIFLCTNATVMLKQLLDANCKNKLDVVNDFRVVFHWSNEVVGLLCGVNTRCMFFVFQVAEFLCEVVVLAITSHLKSKIDKIVVWDLSLDGDFHLFLQLLGNNCSILGSRLYVYADAVHKLVSMTSENDLNVEDLNLIIELLVLSHECFSADCNMEGISTILRKCQTVTSLLVSLENWKLIVRLLTGVGRYTEMVYVFHILRDHDQFEFLLCKGSRRNNALKIALLNYMKRYCPEHRELYRMVALHFTLFSEIALLWEQEAASIMRNLIAISKLEMQNNGLDVDTEPFVLFMNTDGTKVCLNKVRPGCSFGCDTKRGCFLKGYGELHTRHRVPFARRKIGKRHQVLKTS